MSLHAIITRLRAAGCVFAEDEARLLSTAARDHTELHAMVDRRVEGLPLEHILGWAEFQGLRVAVEPGVFVPRRRTELLVQHAAPLLRPHSVVVDLCCGSGAVGAALATIEPRIELHAADIEPAAVKCAHRNITQHGGEVHEGDLYDALPTALRGRVHVIVANAPYVPTDAVALMPPEARDHEPRVALDGGTDGLDLHRRIAAEAPDWLTPGGHLLIETSERQASHTAKAFATNGFHPQIHHSEDLDATVVVGTR
ncbi:putative protein N(5)-glutamine methyltransferase [Allokutzneria sp. A3M-2-11 16]|uniref:putative protein N(5)-glutamine methyltransferase n=1 Tax=Allokutzneria sp. A3M-2-11 16 TaxID=2962043 RepID=UPI0020B8F0F4|nr:putative protein N(5)-glutamine methyltransferase [Allokutzneria sp. A3M-2-11 16]MCP3802960.1 putative protein N(5)-glutamine methyltransferase [Allokutzneria sp. A3M-2-11 16]